MIKAKTARVLRVLIPVLMIALVLLTGAAVYLTRNAPQDAADTETTQPAPVFTATRPTEPLPPPTESEYGPMDFGYVDGYMACLSGPYELGVDVSYWQGSVDWTAVKNAGMEFAMLRLGYRGTGQGTLMTDDYAESNYRNATAAGLKVGVYFFSQAITPEEAREEARYVLDMIKDWDIGMPIVYDWEYVDEEARTANMDGRTLTDCTIAFCEEIKAAGYEPMIYFNPDLERKAMYLEELTGYKFWLAMYTDEMDYPYRVDMWQYTNTGRVPGIDGNCDINLMFLYD